MKKFIMKHLNRGYGYITGFWTAIAVLISIPVFITWWAVGSGKWKMVKATDEGEKKE